jgi:hypothetical protein
MLRKSYTANAEKIGLGSRAVNKARVSGLNPWLGHRSTGIGNGSAQGNPVDCPPSSRATTGERVHVRICFWFPSA